MQLFKNRRCVPLTHGFGRIVAIAVGLLAALNSGHSDAAEAEPDFIVRHATVFDGERRLTDTDVLVQDGRIAAIGRELKAPAGVSVVDGRGKTLMPGLIDAHTHTWGSAGRDALRFGVTTELDMFTDPRGLPAARAQRQARAAAGSADLWSAGVLATVPGGHGTEYGIKIPTLSTPAEAADFVAARKAEGSDYLKIVIEDGSAFGHATPTLDAATIAALATAAKSSGMMSVAHVATQNDAATAFASGVNGLAHVFIDRKLDASADAAFIASARDHFVVPTLSVNAALSGPAESRALQDDPRLKPWLSNGQLGTLASVFPPPWSKTVFLDRALNNTAVLHRAGIALLAGTDAGNPGTAHGVSLHGELALLVRAGLTPLEALRAATSLPSSVFKLSDRGRIATGLRADLLLVEGDPSVDIQATRAIVAIWKNGYPVDRSLRVDERPETAVAAAAGSSLIADFETDVTSVRMGQPLSITTDMMAGGKSSATQAWSAGGANGSKGALKVQGLIDGGLPYAWAGTLWMAGSAPMQAVDYGTRHELVFKVRGEERTGMAMVFSGPSAQSRPAMQSFKIGHDWTEVRLPLAGFAGVDLAKLRAVALTVGLPAGAFSFEIDDLELQ
ncbi:MAG: amidohydrolase family protein [Paucibacter sp.]|nr:amidohydrolase family protein [Roseateles sp.]